MMDYYRGIMRRVKRRMQALAALGALYMLSFSCGCAPAHAGELTLFHGERLSRLSLDGCQSGAVVTLRTSNRSASADRDGPAKGIRHVRGTAETPEISSEQGFNQVVVSWNAECPSGSWLVLHARARKQNGWTRWYNMGWWNAANVPFKRTSADRQRDADGQVDTDTLVLNEVCSAAQVRVTLCAPDAASSPRLKLLACSLARTGQTQPDPGASEAIRGAVLDVPRISQRSYPPKGDVWCSPTSVTMVMNYWAAQRGNREWAAKVPDAAAAIHDERWGGTGNWTFNTAFAGSFPGLAAVVARVNGFADVEAWIARGVPVILSIQSNILHGRSGSGGGHLVVCAGFDQNGDAVVNDPYADLPNGQSVRRTYPREALLKAWHNARSPGTIYLICPTDLLTPDD